MTDDKQPGGQAPASKPQNGHPSNDQPSGGQPQGSPPAKPLTPEEQMALYEADLKENDWGHQPC